MNVLALGTSVTQSAAYAALKEYKANRAKWDKLDMEIARVYRAIANGKTVISVNDAIRKAGVDQLGRPRLAIMAADQQVCLCDPWHSDRVIFSNEHRSKAAEWHFEIPWPETERVMYRGTLHAKLPRIPPQYRPAGSGPDLRKYHILWEADWKAIPRDPYLLKRIGKDAWVVLAAWDLTEIELSVLRAHS